MNSLWPDWHRGAKCLGKDEELFFGSSDTNVRPNYTLADIRKAQAECRECPVFEICLRQTIKNREQYGVWAGTTMKQRATIYRMLADGSTTEDEIVTALLLWRASS